MSTTGWNKKNIAIAGVVLFVILGIILGASFINRRNVKIKEGYPMATAKPFLYGSLNNVKFIIDVNFKIHCKSESVKQQIQKLMDEADSTMEPEYNRHFHMGRSFVNEKNVPLKVEKFVTYERSCNNLVEVEEINKVIGKKPLPFIGGKLHGYTFSLDTDFKIKFSDDLPAPEKKEWEAILKLIIEHDMERSHAQSDYFPDPFSRIYTYFMTLPDYTISKVYFYKKPSRNVPEDPNVIY